MSFQKQKPDILTTEVVARSQLFCIEAQHLRFSNGVERHYERMQPSQRHAVLLVPINDQNELLLVREYCAGTEQYELGFPKGLIDSNETPDEAANRELKEEIGFGARRLTSLKEVILAPSYFSSRMTLFLAQDLFAEQLEGDEPEPLDVVTWPLSDVQALIAHPDFCESRSMTALFLALQTLALSEQN